MRNINKNLFALHATTRQGLKMNEGHATAGPLRGWQGPGTRNNSGPPSNQIQFFSRANLRYRIFQCFLGRWIQCNQNANLAIIKFIWINFVLPCFAFLSVLTSSRVRRNFKRGWRVKVRKVWITRGRESEGRAPAAGGYGVWGQSPQPLKKICNFEVQI